VQQEIGARLLERCQWLKEKPKRILNIGAATGRFTKALQTLYPEADIIGLDRSLKMCEIAKDLSICADMEMLPFKARTFDCIVSNCTLEWSRALPILALECKRVLKEGGTFLFTTLGPDTLNELAAATYEMDKQYHVNAFLDMHHIGDIFLKAGLEDTVVDRETLTVTYSKIERLLLDIKKSGSGHLFQTLKTPFRFKKGIKSLIQEYDRFKLTEGLYPATIEIIYGYAYKRVENLIPTDIITCADS
jgi:malonyl-CoA O-methyltransferase